MRAQWIGLLLLTACPLVGHAQLWEELYAARSGAIEARVELKKYSFRKTNLSGEKIVKAHLRTFYREAATRSTATADYEFHCAGRKAFRSKMKLEVVNPDRTRNVVTVPARTPLEGKEYQDILGMMEILCARER